MIQNSIVALAFITALFFLLRPLFKKKQKDKNCDKCN